MFSTTSHENLKNYYSTNSINGREFVEIPLDETKTKSGQSPSSRSTTIYALIKTGNPPYSRLQKDANSDSYQLVSASGKVEQPTAGKAYAYLILENEKGELELRLQSQGHIFSGYRVLSSEVMGEVDSKEVANCKVLEKDKLYKDVKDCANQEDIKESIYYTYDHSETRIIKGEPKEVVVRDIIGPSPKVLLAGDMYFDSKGELILANPQAGAYHFADDIREKLTEQELEELRSDYEFLLQSFGIPPEKFLTYDEFRNLEKEISNSKRTAVEVEEELNNVRSPRTPKAFRFNPDYVIEEPHLNQENFSEEKDKYKDNFLTEIPHITQTPRNSNVSLEDVMNVRDISSSMEEDVQFKLSLEELEKKFKAAPPKFNEIQLIELANKIKALKKELQVPAELKYSHEKAKEREKKAELLAQQAQEAQQQLTSQQQAHPRKAYCNNYGYLFAFAAIAVSGIVAYPKETAEVVSSIISLTQSNSTGS